MKTNKEIATYALDALKKSGAEHAQCLVSSGKVDEFNVDSGEFSLMRTLFNSSITMKALLNGKKGVITVNKLDKESIDNAVCDCISAADSSVVDEAEAIAPKEENEDFISGVITPDKNKLFDRIQEFMDDVKNEYPKIVLEQSVSKYSNTESVFMNTNGVNYNYTRGHYDISSTFLARDGEKSSSFNGYGVLLDSLDRKIIDVGMLRTLLEESQNQIDTVPYAGKFVGKVIITPACLMDIVLTALGLFTSDSTIIDGTSPWKSMLGKQVASDKLSISKKPLDPQIVCGERFTGEGFKSANMDIIKDGILENFTLSNYASRKTGFPRALNSSYNLFVKPGEISLNELTKSCDRGILLNRFSGGQPSTNGDFSGVAKNSFLIENGKITNALSETMISGNLIDLLNSIIGVSSDTICDGYSVLPYILFDGVTVSGK
jgi:PmbA protein